MAVEAEKRTETVNVNANVIEDMISNLKLDIEARDEHKEQLQNAKDFISEADDRIKGASEALSFMTDYLTDEQIETIEALELYHVDLEPSPNRGSLNEVAQLAFEIINKSKTGQMTNGELYESYAKQAGDNAVKYGDFNIKLRSLYSNVRLIRIEPEDAVNSRDHVIKVNGFTSKK
jgi:hypothetical protein